MLRALRSLDPVGQAVVVFMLNALAGVFAVTAFTALFPDAEGPALTELAGAGTAIGLLAVCAFAALVRPWKVWSRPGTLPWAFGFYALCLVAWVPFAFFAYPWLCEQMGAPLEAQVPLLYLAGEPATQWGRVVMIALACALAPIGEEILYRGYVQGALRQFLKPSIALLLTAAFFGLMHGVMFAIPIGLLGVIFGIVRERCDGVFPAIAVHALHNTLTVVMLFTYPQMMDIYAS